MTITQKILEAMSGKAQGKKVVFAPYENKVKPGKTLDLLLEKGMGLVKRVPFYSIARPNCTLSQEKTEIRDGFYSIITNVQTPYGTLRQINKVNEITSYIEEHFIKSEQDFAAYRFMVEDSQAIPAENYVTDALAAPEYYFMRGGLPYEPYQQLVAQDMGTENFCYFIMDYPDEIAELADCINRFNRKVFPIAADSALPMFNYGGNVVPNIIGKNLFHNVYVPQYKEAATVLHASNKLIGSHFDADNSLILEDIENSELDYIEAYDISFSPPLREAIERAPDKTFWLNFPSSMHMQPKDEIYRTAIQLLKEGSKAKGLVMGVTEDVPEECWETSFLTIQKAIDDFFA